MQPGNFKEIFCRLYLNIVGNSNCQIIGEVITKALEAVFPSLNVEEKVEHVICNRCSVNLFAACNFISTCTDTEGIISPYVNSSKVSQVDLKEVYLKEKGNTHLTDVSGSQRICRLCFQLPQSGFVSLIEVDIDIIDTYQKLFHQGLMLIFVPVICGSCFDSLHTYGGFLKDCLDVHEIHKRADKEPYVKTEPIETKMKEDSQDGQEKYENVDKLSYCIKLEEIEIKLENDQDAQEKYKSTEQQSCIKFEEIGVKVEKNDQDGGFSRGPSLDTQIYQCNRCKYETKLKASLKRHQRTHKNPSKVQAYQCATCSFETNYKSNLNRHQSVVHKEVRTYKCDMCSYEAKVKTHLKTHQLIHKDALNIQMYKCDTCRYETKRKGDLKSHQLLHKDLSEIQTYKCDSCTYEAKYPKCLKVHQLLHKDPSEIQMYKCATCSYETKHKSHLNMHKLMHKDTSEIRMYKCDVCTYVTKFKNYLKVHQVSHKDPSEIKMYKCDV